MLFSVREVFFSEIRNLLILTLFPVNLVDMLSKPFTEKIMFTFLLKKQN